MEHELQLGAEDPLEETRLLAAALQAHSRRAAARGVAWSRVEANLSVEGKSGVETKTMPSSAAADCARSADAGVAAPAPTESPRILAPACATLEDLRAAVARCTACELCRTRTQTVFSDGLGARRILFVGDAPGADEDRSGVPFAGAAGQLLTDIIEKGMRLRRDEVWIANLLKCRPSDNGKPAPRASESCSPWLERQIELMQPRIIIALGQAAASHLLGSDDNLASLRGRVHERRGIPLVATYHPANLLRTPADKKECWQDIQLAMRAIGLQLSS